MTALAVARDGDEFATGHACDTTSTLIGQTGASAKVYVNGLEVVCKGDATQSHNIFVSPSCVPHVATVTGGSATVFVGGKALARKTDAVDSGSITGGSSDVFAG